MLRRLAMRQSVAEGTDQVGSDVRPLKAFLGATWGRSAMQEPQGNAALSDSEHYRAMAKKLRELAREFRFPGARQEILDLASRYERRAERLDARSSAADQNLP